LNAALSIVINIATDQLPEWIVRYPKLTWPVLLLIIVVIAVLSIYASTREQEDSDDETQPATAPITRPIRRLVSWSEIADTFAFVGRLDEQATLSEWIRIDRCRVIGILGMPGLGKSTLAARVAHSLQGEFSDVLWYSLRDLPPFDHFLQEILPLLADQQTIPFPEDYESGIALLLKLISDKRILLVIDNFESIIPDNTEQSAYRSGFEPYGLLIQRFAEAIHQSCLIITSREMPREFIPLEGGPAIKSLLLEGM
jgi:hypothetical protein